jgi:hypothetical protein
MIVRADRKGVAEVVTAVCKGASGARCGIVLRVAHSLLAPAGRTADSARTPRRPWVAARSHRYGGCCRLGPLGPRERGAPEARGNVPWSRGGRFGVVPAAADLATRQDADLLGRHTGARSRLGDAQQHLGSLEAAANHGA